jgi:FMN-dependent NADH-azoreductase
MGMTDVSFIRAEKLAFGPEAVEASIAGAKGHLQQVTGAQSVAA